MAVEISLKGIDVSRALIDRFPKAVAEASRLAVAETGRFAFRESSKEIRGQINFTREYLGGEASGGKRLKIQRGVRGGQEFIRITAREVPTSLARFVVGTPVRGKPIRVKVSPRGGARSIPGAFPVRLRRGKTLTEDSFNEGIAIRLSKSRTIRERAKGTDGLPELFPGVFLLYGPSVAQVFNTVSTDVKPRVGRKLETEFLRQFKRLSKQGA